MEWKISKDLVEYPEALAFMDERVAGIRAGEDECVWFLEHPALYTAGTSAKPEDLLDARFPVFETGRGGEHTYHGPGQRVAYVMLDLKEQAQKQHSRAGGNQDPRLHGDALKVMPDIKKYVWQLEEWIIRALARFDVQGERRDGRVGIWVVKPDGAEAKIAALGVRVRRWVTLHGVSINVAPDLSHFGGIVPCGISDYGVTSLADLGVTASMEEVDAALQAVWGGVFG
ncbi:MAG: lipoate-protein ligase B [Alphaproteobacteria bacterium]|nr:lipoate-protein ligase B [Alphaproteobacteria bacterium]